MMNCEEISGETSDCAYKFVELLHVASDSLCSQRNLRCKCTFKFLHFASDSLCLDIPHHINCKELSGENANCANKVLELLHVASDSLCHNILYNIN